MQSPPRYSDYVKRQRGMQTDGPLAGHVRKGRRFLSPLAATGVLQIGDWVRDDLPDLLWPVLTLAEQGSGAAIKFVRWQKAVQNDLAGRAEPQLLAESLDGRLTSLDGLVDEVPEAEQIIKDRAAEYGLLPQSVARALASYPERPATWLVDLELAPPTQAEVDLLSRAILETLSDGHREAIIKCLSIWSAVQAGRFSTDATTINLLKPYPNDAATRPQADTVIRASWSAQKGLKSHHDPTHFNSSIQWAKVFWGTNSMTTACLRQRDVDDQGAPRDASGEDTHPATTPADGEHLRGRAMDLLSSYIEALETAPARLYDQEQQEVHSGLVTRAGREVITALGAPDLWCVEHGAHVGRTLVEVRIYIEWMALQDPSVYRSYQTYGAGKAKLYARITDELAKDWNSPEVEKAIEELDKLSHNHDVLDHRVVDTRDSFAEGKSIRAMAKECGLLDLYRQSYSLASGVAHSEWWSLETHCMEPCRNILHRGHLIPSLTLSGGADVALASSWISQFYALIRRSLQILRTNQDAVDQAFSWLSTDNASAESFAPGEEQAQDDMRKSED